MGPAWGTPPLACMLSLAPWGPVLTSPTSGTMSPALYLLHPSAGLGVSPLAPPPAPQVEDGGNTHETPVLCKRFPFLEIPCQGLAGPAWLSLVVTSRKPSLTTLPRVSPPSL